MTGEANGRAADTLVITPPGVNRIVGHLRASLPNEGVGLLAVEASVRRGRTVALTRKFYAGSNIRQSPTRYELDPRELIVALREIDARGWTLGAIVHSHPRGPASPSATDLAEFQYPEALMVIVSFAGTVPEIRAWKLQPAAHGWTPLGVPIVSDAETGSRPPIAVDDEFRE